MPGDTDVTVSIPIVNDTIVEGEESFDVVLEASSIGVAVGHPRQAEVTIAGKKFYHEPRYWFIKSYLLFPLYA